MIFEHLIQVSYSSTSTYLENVMLQQRAITQLSLQCWRKTYGFYCLVAISKCFAPLYIKSTISADAISWKSCEWAFEFVVGVCILYVYEAMRWLCITRNLNHLICFVFIDYRLSNHRAYFFDAGYICWSKDNFPFLVLLIRWFEEYFSPDQPFSISEFISVPRGFLQRLTHFN